MREVHSIEDPKLICNNNDNEVLVKLRKQTERTVESIGEETKSLQSFRT